MCCWVRGSPFPVISSRTRRLGQRLGLASLPEVSLSERLGEALVVGLWRPVVLLPLAWAMEMPPDALAAVLAHELAHVRRWDLSVAPGPARAGDAAVLSSGGVVALAPRQPGAGAVYG